MYKRWGKRFFDILLSALGIAVLLLPMALVTILIPLNSPGPVFFKQRRVGKGKQYFTIWKFRTMPVQAPHDTPTHLLDNPEQMLTNGSDFFGGHQWMSCRSLSIF